MPKGRKVMIGLDGMPYGLMHKFAGDGTMPSFGALVEEGILVPMASSIPEVSSVAWSSVITGTNPGEHGIYGFTDIAPGTYRLTFPNFGTLRARPFWERPDSGRSVVLNVPTTFPARKMNGVLIAGFVALDLERATYPRSLVPKLQEMNYTVDVDSQKAHESLGFFLRELDETLQARIAAHRHLWHEEVWDTFVLVFTGTDRLAHFLWDAYEDEAHEYHEAFLEHFRQIDEAIGEIVENLAPNDSLIMLSDHGFERLEKNVFVNHLLVQEGFLAFDAGAAPRLRTISADTRAFALDPGRIYVNLKDKYPRGSVEAADLQFVLDDLQALFSSLEVADSAGTPRKVIKRVYHREELYSGSQVDRAPELVLLGNSGFNLRGNMQATQLTGTDLFAGKHSQHDAFLLVWSNSNALQSTAADVVPESPSVSDIVSIMDTL